MDKTIKINGEEYFYKTENTLLDGWGIDHWSYFFKEYSERKFKRFIFFGKEVVIKTPIKLFEVNFNVDSISWSDKQKLEFAEKKFRKKRKNL